MNENNITRYTLWFGKEIDTNKNIEELKLIMTLFDRRYGNRFYVLDGIKKYFILLGIKKKWKKVLYEL